MIRILIVEDSNVVALLLRALLEQEPDMEIVGHARNGREAVSMTHDLKPDLITMDIRMPMMDGFEATRMIMSTMPTPIVVVSSSVDNEELRTTFRAIEEGALAVIEKPRGAGHPAFEQIRCKLVNTVRAMAEVKLVRRHSRRSAKKPADISGSAASPQPRDFELVALGSSTGGPQALQTLLASLPLDFALPIVVVQHISPGFVSGMARWLGSLTLLDVRLVEDGESLQPGKVYLAPDDRHLLVTRCGRNLCARLSGDPPLHMFRPSATTFMESVARVCGDKAVGGLLSGMGADGAQGLLEMRRAGGYTFVQSPESCVVAGMPGSAISLDAVQDVVSLEHMAPHLLRLTGKPGA